jgi:hypothetical protein
MQTLQTLIFLLTQWLVVFGTAALLFLGIGFLVALLQHGTAAPRLTFETLKRGYRDLLFLSPRRIGAIARLTFIEAYRRKAFAIGLLFLGIIMFAGWFVQPARNQSIAPYISTVITPMWFMLVPMSLLVACWGLPGDIKERSVHTVVTKPVRRSEIVIGRMFGYGAVLTVLLIAVAAVNYFWLIRQIPERLRDQLVARVPIYVSNEVDPNFTDPQTGRMGLKNFYFLDRSGARVVSGINVGDPWEYRSYIEGQTEARAIWTFTGLNVDELKQLGGLPLEHRFEAFRTYKGDIALQTRFRMTLENPETKFRVTLKELFPVREYATGGRERVLEIPAQIPYRDSYRVGAEEKVADLFSELISPDGRLTVEIACVEPQQFIGVNPADLFVRLPDRSFAMNYVKAMAGIWMLIMLLVCFGTSASCFVKGPVATLLCTGIIILGYFLGGQLEEQRAQLLTTGKIDGGGPIESLYRLVTKASEMPDNLGAKAVEATDNAAFALLNVTRMILPDLRSFRTEADETQLGLDISRGFDIPPMAMFYRFLTLLGYFVPLVVLGYFSLQLRELEHK